MHVHAAGVDIGTRSLTATEGQPRAELDPIVFLDHEVVADAFVRQLGLVLRPPGVARTRALQLHAVQVAARRTEIVEELLVHLRDGLADARLLLHLIQRAVQALDLPPFVVVLATRLHDVRRLRAHQTRFRALNAGVDAAKRAVVGLLVEVSGRLRLRGAAELDGRVVDRAPEGAVVLALRQHGPQRLVQFEGSPELVIRLRAHRQIRIEVPEAGEARGQRRIRSVVHQDLGAVQSRLLEVHVDRVGLRGREYLPVGYAIASKPNHAKTVFLHRVRGACEDRIDAFPRAARHQKTRRHGFCFVFFYMKKKKNGLAKKTFFFFPLFFFFFWER